MLTLAIDGREYTCEGGYNELSQRRLVGLMRIESSSLSEGQKLWKRICYLLQLTGKQQRELATVPAAVLHDIATREDCLGWVRQTEALLQEYTMHGFWHRGVYYVGPPKRLLRINASELVLVHSLFSQYHHSKNDEHLAHLLAVLYRPLNPLWWLRIFDGEWTGDKRLPLNDWTLVRRTRRFKKLDPALTMATVKQLTSALQMFEQRFKRVFKKGKDNGTANPAAWVNLLFAMSGGAFGDFTKTEKTDCSLVFMKIEFDMQQQEEMERMRTKKTKR